MKTIDKSTKTQTESKPDPEKVIQFTVKNWYWIQPLLKYAYNKTIELFKRIKTRKKKKQNGKL